MGRLSNEIVAGRIIPLLETDWRRQSNRVCLVPAKLAAVEGCDDEVGTALQASPKGLSSLTLFRSFVQYSCYTPGTRPPASLGAFLWPSATFLQGPWNHCHCRPSHWICNVFCSNFTWRRVRSKDMGPLRNPFSSFRSVVALHLQNLFYRFLNSRLASCATLLVDD
ncbi:uncharacterized protein LOC135613614 [Musa acuminata AAA Group]|uniref:uncharacterized protein LOC135613614 n=1 Tax=Musa acuminata AAA Group TaxID=214697 RepID=UPI0031D84BB4